MKQKNRVILDVECYVDYFLVSFLSVKTGQYREYEFHDDCKFRGSLVSDMMTNFTTISFNGNKYDLIMIRAALSGWSNFQLKKLSDEIIMSDKPSWIVAKNSGLQVPRHWDHIDLIEVAPGQASLKIYGGRMHSDKLQDLPLEPSANIMPEQRELMRLYCRNDLITTLDLLNTVDKQLLLREKMGDQYSLDLRSKSDSQIAEALVKNYLIGFGVTATKRASKIKPFKYRLPSWVEFESVEFNEMLAKVLDCTFSINDKGSVVMPKELNKAVEYKGGKYKFGIGGLHSQEKSQVIIPTADQLYGEFDVASMYPSIIIEQGLYPLHLGAKFLEVYSSIKDTRLKAKRAKDKVTDGTYKIVLNGSYGKFGSKYSFLYSPELLIQTTITGQLSLLMLIEKMTLAGGKVVSANTDGVNVIYDKSIHDDIHNVQFDWEITTSYELEYTPYLATYSRDVNNYIAIKEDGCKGKGAFAEPNMMKNPTNEICVLAVKDYVTNNTPIIDTITQCVDITKFLCVRSVTGGAVWRDQYLGKAVRWYYSSDGDTITYKKNGNKVPKSDGAKPLMDLCEGLPVDLNLSWYYDECVSMLKDLGVDYARK
jgi:hypothetical protein